MKFLVGLLAGMLLAGPTVEHHYHVTETNRLRMDREVTVQSPDVYEVVVLEDEDERSACVVDLLGGPGADWDADDAIAVLDEAWDAGVSPCELERR